MARTLSAPLTTEMDSLIRQPRSMMTVERWLPEWTEKQSAGDTDYRHGHNCAVSVDGWDEGEDVLFRARVSDTGELEVASIKEDDLDDPTTWESLYLGTGQTGFQPPKWASNSAANFGGDVCVVAGPPYAFRVFAVKTTGEINYYDYSIYGALSGSGTVTTITISSSVQFAACSTTELFVLDEQLVEASNDSWQDDVVGAKIRRFVDSGGWSEDSNPYLFHTHNRGGLLTDKGIGDASSEVEPQWGFRPNGGLAVLEVDEDTVTVIFAGRFYWQKSYTIHTASLMAYQYHRDNGLWSFVWQNDEAEYDTENQLWAAGFVRGFNIEGNNFVSWVRLNEPVYEAQQADALAIPREEETVYASVSPNGRHVSHWQWMGESYTFASGSVVVINHSGTKRLYAIGYEAIKESSPAAFFCTVPSDDLLDMERYCSGFAFRQNNRWTLDIKTTLEDSSPRFSSFLREGNLIRIYHGIEGELLQVAMGYIDGTQPSLSLARRNYSAGLAARNELQLLHTKAESVEDWLPMETYTMVPEDPGESGVVSNYVDGKLIEVHHPNSVERKGDGWFRLAKPEWPTLWFPGDYDTIDLVYRNEGYPQALTGGGAIDLPEGVEGGPGIAAEEEKRGTMYGDMFWMLMEPKVDVAIQASFRMGDNRNANNFGFTTAYGTYTSLDVKRTNGLVTNIEYYDINDDLWNDVAQESAACGLVFRSVQDPLDIEGTGKKYIFMWEANSDLQDGSHLEDQAGRFWGYGGVFDQPNYNSLPVGKNKLYLLMSDFDETDESWQDNDKYLHKALLQCDATGLTTGRPADLRLQVLGGHVHCFYRPYRLKDSTPYLWRKAFDYNTGHFGAGKAGCVLRGHNTILWDAFRPEKEKMRRYNNDVDVWAVEAADTTLDLSLEELIEQYAWRGHTATEFRSLIDDSRTVAASGLYSYGTEIENILIEATITISTNGEAGMYFRATDEGDPTQGAIYLGLVVNSTYEEGDKTVNCYIVKRRYSGGAEVVTARDYSPSPIHLKPNVSYLVRFSIRNDLMTVYVNGNYVGHFHDDTELGRYFGLYAGVSSDFVVFLRELYEVPENSLVDPGQSMMDVIKRTVGHRHIKGVFRHNGALLVSKFLAHDAGPAYEEQVKASNLSLTDRFLNVVEVQGADPYCLYAHEPTKHLGRHYALVSQPNLMTVENCYNEGKYTVQDSMEHMRLLSLDSTIDMRIEPEDEITATVEKQDIDGENFLIEDIQTTFNLPKREASQSITTRQRYDI